MGNDKLPRRGRGHRNGSLSLGEGEGRGEGARVFTDDPLQGNRAPHVARVWWVSFPLDSGAASRYSDRTDPASGGDPRCSGGTHPRAPPPRAPEGRRNGRTGPSPADRAGRARPSGPPALRADAGG